MDRRLAIKSISALGLAAVSGGYVPSMQTMLSRQIPSTRESLPVIGLGTWQTFDVGVSLAERAPLREVLRAMAQRGGRVIDSSPMYGRSEAVVGDLSTEEKINDKFFLATKVWTSGIDNGIQQMNRSFAYLKRQTIDLMQIHNLVDWKVHLRTLRDWKEQGRIRYIGITHYLDAAHEQLEAILKEYPVDFIQCNYSIISRHAETRLFPAAADKGVAVLVNRPFEEGALFELVKDKPVPAWSADFDCNSWGQFFLKFILSDPRVTCAIPGTSKVNHLIDNMGAAVGLLPDEKQRQRMISTLD